MQLDAMVNQRLKGDPGLASLLASFDGTPAVFYQQAPHAQHTGWGKHQYPRIDFIIDTQEDPARNTSGVLTIHVWCDATSPAEPETIDIRLRALLHAMFARADDNPYCIAWVRSDAWQIRNKDEASGDTFGITLTFDLIAFPPQQTTSPDPVDAINAWTKTIMPEATIIGLDDFTGWLEPTRAAPVVYWRNVQQSINQQKHVVTWLDVTLEGHVFARSAPDRLSALTRIETAAAMINHITMDDSSPMFITNIFMMQQMNYIRQGQLTARARYGILQDWYSNPPAEPKLRHITAPIKAR